MLIGPKISRLIEHMNEAELATGKAIFDMLSQIQEQMDYLPRVMAAIDKHLQEASQESKEEREDRLD